MSKIYQFNGDGKVVIGAALVSAPDPETAKHLLTVRPGMKKYLSEPRVVEGLEFHATINNPRWQFDSLTYVDKMYG